jgi:hypothetical protein
MWAPGDAGRATARKWGVVVLLGIAVVLVLLINFGVRRPSLNVVGLTARDGFSGLDYTMWVECAIGNTGASSEVIVSVELIAPDGFWKKSRQVSIPSDETRLVTFEFPEVSALASGLQGFDYECYPE